jgi:hypothetical protein
VVKPSLFFVGDDEKYDCIEDEAGMVLFIAGSCCRVESIYWRCEVRFEAGALLLHACDVKLAGTTLRKSRYSEDQTFSCLRIHGC